MSFTPRKYQTRIAADAVAILKAHKIVYLALEVRTGKTFTALMAAHHYGAVRVLFLTVKKAIKGIENDIETFGKLDVDVLSIDSAHKAAGDYDLIIIDEAHGIGAFPKPSKRAKSIKEVADGLPIILLSGTPHPESLSQCFHQFWVSSFSPFKEYGNFYKWSKDYVDVRKMKFNGFEANDYSRGIQTKFDPIIAQYFLTFSQEEADFNCEVKEHILTVDMNLSTVDAINRLKKDKVLVGAEHTVLADTPVKLLSKVHQMSSGTVIAESGDYIIFDRSKALYIADKFKGKKIAIYYKFQSEYDMIKEIYGDNLTTDVEEFQTGDKNIALQIKAGSMGIGLSAADCQVFLNLDFSSKDYIQSRARLQTQKRESVDVYFIFGKGGIEFDIYKALQKKQDYTSRYFKKLYF